MGYRPCYTTVGIEIRENVYHPDIGKTAHVNPRTGEQRLQTSGYRAFPARRGGGGGECGGGKYRYRRGGERNRHDLHEQNSVLVPAMPRGGGLLNRMHDTPVGAQ